MAQPVCDKSPASDTKTEVAEDKIQGGGQHNSLAFQRRRQDVAVPSLVRSAPNSSPPFAPESVKKGVKRYQGESRPGI